MKTMNRILQALTVSCVLSFIAHAQGFTTFNNFPTPAPGAFSVVGEALDDGRLLVWNGDDVFIQLSPTADKFVLHASGYAGDPGFISIAPSGAFAILGEGFGGRLYRIDLPNPVDFAPSSVVATRTHYAGDMLSENLVLMDAGKSDFSGSELVILDLSGAKSVPVPVVRKPDWGKAVVVDKPPFAYSASIFVDFDLGYAFAMDGNTRELRAFQISLLIAAFEGGTTLDWNTQGALIGNAGDYFSGGVAGADPDGNLIIGGSAGFGQPGGIQIVDNDTADVIQTYDPAGNMGFYSVIYNHVTDTIIAFEGGTVYSNGTVAAVPAASAAGLVCLAGALAAFGTRRRK